jgi:precorrin-2 dehydrogenase / sirohydrochlorin ferrochelatase
MKKSEKAGFYPILINLQRLNCLIVGGGKVAFRKVISLLKFNAVITVVSPRISKPIIELAKQSRIRVIKKSYSAEFIEDAGIVFCATDNPEINKMVRKDCSKKGILLNVADEPALCDFILPANVIRGDLTISVSSQGKAPFYTKEMKRKLEGFVDPVYEEILSLAGELRKEILSDKKFNQKEKAKIFKKFTAKDWEKILGNNGKKSNKRYIKELLKQFNS